MLSNLRAKGTPPQIAVVRHLNVSVAQNLGSLAMAAALALVTRRDGR
jgi:hypothetical protein